MTKLAHPWKPGPAKTEAGEDVRILAVDAEGHWPIVGLIWRVGEDIVIRWNSQGRANHGGRVALAPPEPERLSGFVNVFHGFVGGIYPTRREADGAGFRQARIACIDLSKHHVGEGLE